jgi:hypothetical protein
MSEAFLNPDRIRKIKCLLGICLLISGLAYSFLLKTENISNFVKVDYLYLIYPSGESLEIRYKDLSTTTKRSDLDLGNFATGVKTEKFKVRIYQNDEYGESELRIYSNAIHYLAM